MSQRQKQNTEMRIKKIEVNIVDVAGVAAAMMGMASWATVEIDRESDDGYERTTKIGGNKAFEKYDANQKTGELNLIVDERFIIAIKGRNIEEKDLRKALDKISVKKLSRLEESNKRALLLFSFQNSVKF